LFASGKKTKVPKISSAEWLPVIYHQTRKGGQEKFGVLSRTDWTQKPARLIIFESVPKGSHLEIYIFGNMPQDRVQGELVELQKLQLRLQKYMWLHSRCNIRALMKHPDGNLVAGQ